MKTIQNAAPGFAPSILSFKIDNGDRPIFISHYKDLSPLRDPAAGKALATRLATELQAYKSVEGFGFHVPTYCGATRMKNGWFESWEECFGEMISDLSIELRQERYDEALYSTGEKVKRK